MVAPETRQNTSLRDIYSDNCETLKCKKNSHLMKALPSLPGEYASLRDLDLNWNFVGRVGVKAVLEVVKFAPKIEKLCLADNFLNNDSVKELVNIIHNHGTLSHLDLSRNPISHVAGKLLSEYAGNNPNIRSILLDDTLINPALVRIIERKVSSNRLVEPSCNTETSNPSDVINMDLPSNEASTNRSPTPDFTERREEEKEDPHKTTPRNHPKSEEIVAERREEESFSELATDGDAGEKREESSATNHVFPALRLLLGDAEALSGILLLCNIAPKSRGEMLRIVFSAVQRQPGGDFRGLRLLHEVAVADEVLSGSLQGIKFSDDRFTTRVESTSPSEEERKDWPSLSIMFDVAADQLTKSKQDFFALQHFCALCGELSSSMTKKLPPVSPPLETSTPSIAPSSQKTTEQQAPLNVIQSLSSMAGPGKWGLEALLCARDMPQTQPSTNTSDWLPLLAEMCTPSTHLDLLLAARQFKVSDLSSTSAIPYTSEQKLVSVAKWLNVLQSMCPTGSGLKALADAMPQFNGLSVLFNADMDNFSGLRLVKAAVGAQPDPWYAVRLVWQLVEGTQQQNAGLQCILSCIKPDPVLLR